ncbi:type II and III secretion system protein [Flavobacterium salilacus subsp. salilacus]|uniref:type II secretion system protein GspD n=1 Tax=Flavobacterium TaxID=237 RepID=UPI00107546B4|nr:MULTISPECIES: general secretion pathway protein GspD [Flavobacterium]KAF2518525.1 type II and III secretion system protein [Flavobacterium salilacus subsp. salilacus]MBE1615167.1 general secretion pathway protein GspD [Flavobacterium sp. SaA2.13]
MKKILFCCILLTFTVFYGQEDKHIEQIRNNIELIFPDTPGLAEKVNVNIKQATLSDFLLAVSEVHKVNISVDPALKQTTIVNNFSDVIVADLILFLCKEYKLTVEFTGNILAVKPYAPPVEAPKEKVIDVDYNYNNELLSLNLKDDKLYDAFKKIMDESGRNLVFTPGMENQLLTVYIKNMPFDAALNKLAYANNLYVTKSKDNFYLFDRLDAPAPDKSSSAVSQNKPQRQRRSNFFFNILDKDRQLLEVDFENTPISSIVYDIGTELQIDLFIASPLENAGNATVKAKNITFDELLMKMFEANATNAQANNAPPQQQFNNTTGQQGAANDFYTFLKENNIYYFGTKSQLTVRNVKAIPLMHRSIELLGDPDTSQRTVGRTSASSFSSYNGSFDNRTTNQPQQNQNDNRGSSQPAESILTIIPDEVKKDLDIKIDRELNSFIVNGPAENINRFESFIKYIDKPVPVILIEVMLLEISRSAIIETGISAGIGDKPTTTTGTVFPTSDITLGASTINKIINRFDGFGSLNIGNVVPDFYLSLKAMEANGDLKIRSAPRLSTLNGHKAQLSIGETTYYVVTNQNFYGSQIPQASEIKNYQPIDAELSVSIKPLVSGDGQITLDIRVVQSSFNGERIDEDAPPGINSREFTSIIRVRDQDLIVLGGLEEKVKNDSGSGVPLLARIPIIKWLFSSRKREDSRKKLTVLIKPTVIY